MDPIEQINPPQVRGPCAGVDDSVSVNDSLGNAVDNGLQVPLEVDGFVTVGFEEEAMHF